jgi:4'-phosphopantetheinyl transferase
MVFPELAPECGSAPIVCVCSLNVSDHGAHCGRMVEWLSPEERIRSQRFFREADRRRFVLGRAIIRHLCAEYLGLEPARVLLELTSAGKLYLANTAPRVGRRLEFNISHSGDCILVAWAEGRPVGVDVEALDRDIAPEYHQIAQIAFSDAEYATLSSAWPDEVPSTFYRIWVRKEAVLKGEGCGFGGSVRSFSVARRHVGYTEWFDEVCYPKSGCRWAIVDLIPLPDHLGALALPQGSVIYWCTPSNIGFFAY